MEPNITTECLLKTPLGFPSRQTSLDRFWPMTLMVRTVPAVFVAAVCYKPVTPVSYPI